MKRFHIIECSLGFSFDVRAPSLELAFAGVRAFVQHDAMLLDVALPCERGARIVDVMPAPPALVADPVPDSTYWVEVAGDRLERLRGPFGWPRGW